MTKICPKCGAPLAWVAEETENDTGYYECPKCNYRDPKSIARR